MVDGYYYLHRSSGALMWKRAAPGLIEDFENSDFVACYWPVELSDRRSAWRICIEASVRGADPRHIAQRMKTWHMNDEDAREYARREGLGLVEEAGTWRVADPLRGLHAAGITPLGAFCGLYRLVHKQ